MGFLSQVRDTVRIAFQNPFFSLSHHLSYLVFFSSIFLSGCIVPINNGTYEQAKIDYYNGNPSRAFVELWRPAQLNDPRALYAMGYMYYYGIGTDKDIDLGRKLIHVASDFQYPPAITALKIIYAPVHEQYAAFEDPRTHGPFPLFGPRGW